MRLALCQLNPIVGDIDGNIAAIAAAYRDAVEAGADLVATGELASAGYPPEDLLLKPAFVTAVARGLDRLAAACGAVPLVVGFVERLEGDAVEETRQPSGTTGNPVAALANAAAVCRSGSVEAVYRKQRLPNYGVFDEARYFRAGTQPLVISAAGTRVGITICEDLWGEDGPVSQATADGAELVLNLNASPFHRGKRARREWWAAHHAQTSGAWIGYVNQVGGQDDVVFDGDSFLVAPDGAVVARGAEFATDTVLADLPVGDDRAPTAGEVPRRLDDTEAVYQALVLATRDYARKNGFTELLLGLSGGVDSALVAVIAADALGPGAVTAVTMPSPYTSEESKRDAKALIDNLGLHWLDLPITPAMEAVTDILTEPFAGTESGTAEENIQSRLRGLLLMALSNKFGHLLLATGNKSEFAVGYATLYGDMAGGFAVLKDVPKLVVYELCRHRNRRGAVLPDSVIDKAPTAELAPNQIDTDSLPPYEVLDPLLAGYVEHNRSVDDLIDEGFDPETVRRVVRMVDRAEYKRRQGPPGPKITERAFGKDRRLPITQAWDG